MVLGMTDHANGSSREPAPTFNSADDGKTLEVCRDRFDNRDRFGNRSFGSTAREVPPPAPEGALFVAHIPGEWSGGGDEWFAFERLEVGKPWVAVRWRHGPGVSNRDGLGVALLNERDAAKRDAREAHVAWMEAVTARDAAIARAEKAERALREIGERTVAKLVQERDAAIVERNQARGSLIAISNHAKATAEPTQPATPATPSGSGSATR